MVIFIFLIGGVNLVLLMVKVGWFNVRLLLCIFLLKLDWESLYLNILKWWCIIFFLNKILVKDEKVMIVIIDIIM